MLGLSNNGRRLRLDNLSMLDRGDLTIGERQMISSQEPIPMSLFQREKF